MQEEAQPQAPEAPPPPPRTQKEKAGVRKRVFFGALFVLIIIGIGYFGLHLGWGALLFIGWLFAR